MKQGRRIPPSLFWLLCEKKSGLLSSSGRDADQLLAHFSERHLGGDAVHHGDQLGHSKAARVVQEPEFFAHLDPEPLPVQPASFRQLQRGRLAFGAGQSAVLDELDPILDSHATDAGNSDMQEGAVLDQPEGFETTGAAGFVVRKKAVVDVEQGAGLLGKAQSPAPFLGGQLLHARGKRIFNFTNQRVRR